LIGFPLWDVDYYVKPREKPNCVGSSVQNTRVKTVLLIVPVGITSDHYIFCSQMML
jgi:hypothetical protein